MRTLTPQMDAALRAKVTRPVLLFDLTGHPARDLYLWTGVGSLVWDGKTYVGAGRVLSASPVEYSTELQVDVQTYRLDASRLSAEAEAIVTSPVTRLNFESWKALLDEHHNVIPDPIKRTSGWADPPRLIDGDERIVELTVKGRLFNLVKPARTLISHEEQQKRFPGDTGLGDMAEIQDQTTVWETGPYNGFSPP